MKRRSRTSDLGDEAEVDLTNDAEPAVVGAGQDFLSPVQAEAQADRGIVDRAQRGQTLMRREQPEMESMEQLQRTLGRSSKCKYLKAG